MTVTLKMEVALGSQSLGKGRGPAPQAFFPYSLPHWPLAVRRFQAGHPSLQPCDETFTGCWFPHLGTVTCRGYQAGLLPAAVRDQSLALSHTQTGSQGPHLAALSQGLSRITVQPFPWALMSEKSADAASPPPWSESRESAVSPGLTRPIVSSP